MFESVEIIVALITLIGAILGVIAKSLDKKEREKNINIENRPINIEHRPTFIYHIVYPDYMVDEYTNLENLLRNGMWKEADNETARMMCQIVGRENKGYLRTKYIKHFPCKELLIIDDLWLHYSNRHFGFSVQKEIYQNLGGTRKDNIAIWHQFEEYIGWRGLYYNELTFNLNAPRGHLPRSLELRGKNFGFAGQKQWVALFSRLEVCKN